MEDLGPDFDGRDMDLTSLTAEDIFVPGLDPGLALMRAPEWMWRAQAQAWIGGIALSDHAEQRAACRAFIARYRAAGRFSQAVEFNTLAAVAEDVVVERGIVTVRGKAVLNGAHGARLRNRIVWSRGRAEGLRFDRALIRRLGEAAKTAAAPVMAGEMPEDMVVECRNGHNYYHFLSETLCHLCLAVEIGLRGRVRIHAPRSKLRGFVEGFVAALFPELAGRVDFVVGGVHRYGRAVLGLNVQQLYFMSGAVPALDGLAPANPVWQGRRADRGAYALLNMNAFDHDLGLLRARGRRLAPGGARPRRIWVARNPGFSGRRPMLGEEHLARELGALGFERVCFEDLPPLEQIAHVAQAEAIVLGHGAGLANMLFAAPGALVVEVSNQQTLEARFGDFHQHAHAAGCRYLVVACDHNVADPAQVPRMEDGHVGVSVSAEAAARIGDVLRGFLEPGAVRDPAGVIRLMREAGAELGAVTEAWPEAVAGDAELLLARAGARAEEKRFAEALEDLVAAWDLLPARAALLERIIRLANRLGQREAAAEYLRLHALTFRWRHERFLEECPWLRALAAYGGPARR